APGGSEQNTESGCRTSSSWPGVTMGSWARPAKTVEHDGPLDLLDRFGDLDPAGAGLGAVERGPAPEHAALLRQDGQALLPRLIAGPEIDRVGVTVASRAVVPLAAPELGARGGAGSDRDLLDRFVQRARLGGCVR